VVTDFQRVLEIGGPKSFENENTSAAELSVESIHCEPRSAVFGNPKISAHRPHPKTAKTPPQDSYGLEADNPTNYVSLHHVLVTLLWSALRITCCLQSSGPSQDLQHHAIRSPDAVFNRSNVLMLF
jgi:hypothetical protein